MIELKDIAKISLSGEVKLYALNHVNLRFAGKEYVCVVGPSGSGEYILDGKLTED